MNETYLNLIPLVVIIPLCGLFLNLLLGKWLGERGAGILGSLAAAGSFAVAIYLTVRLAGNPEAQVYTLAPWFTIGSFSLAWAFRLDTLSATMMLVVSGVGTLIHIYSIGYMRSDVRHNGDPGRFRRFFVYLNLFIAAMMLLVTADSYLMLFVGWEGVGLCSYLLIGFWFEKGADGIGNAKAANKAFVVNRIGDFGLLIAMFLLLGAFGSLDFETVFAGAPGVSQGLLVAVTLFMLLGVAGKSAQLPLYVWLPDAMAGPTPVSALIHAATMVTAGVYLIVRSQALFVAALLAGQVTAWVGAATALFAATIAVGQTDIKKVLAYSTISQLGFMVAAAGMGALVAAMFHLTTHAFFKALLFLSAGSIILGMEHGAEHAGGHGHELDPQDMRNMGGLRSRMKLTFAVYLIGALALAGIAPLAGFFSKDEILAAAASTNGGILVVLLIAAFLTAFYMGRQLFLVFGGQPRTPAAGGAQESPALVTVPLLILALLSVLGGGLNLPGVHTLDTWLEHTLRGLAPGEFQIGIAALSLAVALGGLLVAWLVYGRRQMESPEEPDPLSKSLGGLYTGMNRKWWVDEFYHAILVRPFEALSGVFADPIDQGVIDDTVNGFGSLAQWLSTLLRRLQNGFVRSYALIFTLGVLAILTWLIFR